MIGSTIVHAHQHAAGGRWRIHRNGIGRSRGGLPTKIHTRTNAQGLAIGFCLISGQASDLTSHPELMDDNLPDQEAMLAD